MSNAAWCDLNSAGDILKVYDMCPNARCTCQKQYTFTPKPFEIEETRFKNQLQEIFKGTQTIWNNFLSQRLTQQLLSLVRLKQLNRTILPIDKLQQRF